MSTPEQVEKWKKGFYRHMAKFNAGRRDTVEDLYSFKERPLLEDGYIMGCRDQLLEDENKMEDLMNAANIQALRISAGAATINQLQARIDALMLEHCPEDMTPEQIATYEKCQKPAGHPYD